MVSKPFFIWQGKILKKINPEDVVALATEENYTKILLANDRYFMMRSSLSNALKKLPPNLFIKIHRSYAVSVNYIDQIDKDHLLADGEPVAIGKLYYQELLEKLVIIE
jgi:DNA-binding LytR/AlgR family response regulator